MPKSRFSHAFISLIKSSVYFSISNVIWMVSPSCPMQEDWDKLSSFFLCLLYVLRLFSSKQLHPIIIQKTKYELFHSLISHYMFVNDLIIFYQANVSNITKVKKIMQLIYQYQQVINFSSGIQ